MLTCPARRLLVTPRYWSRRPQACPLFKPTWLIPPTSLHSLSDVVHLSKCSFAQSNAPRKKPPGNGVKAKVLVEKESESQTTWVNDLEPLLPPHLRSSSFVGHGSSPEVDEASAAIVKIIANARQKGAGIDVLAELGVKHERWSAVLYIVETLITGAFEAQNCRTSVLLPSNLDWPTNSLLDEISAQPFELDGFTISTASERDVLQSESPIVDEVDTEKPSAISQIWMSLGTIILEAANFAQEHSGETMSYVYQIIARLHNSGLVPDHIYTYVPTVYSSIVHRPPSMPLLSSKILTTLSDAAWHARRDAQATNTLNKGAADLPPDSKPAQGRFRSKVRALGCDIWLEFVLWCCADKGFPAAGSWIIGRMQTQGKESPWHAARWPLAPADGISSEALIEQIKDQVHQSPPGKQAKESHHFGNSTEQEDRTISVEVVLALIEAAINARIPETDGSGSTQEAGQTIVTKLLTFLEPNVLPPEYFDYLTVRLLQRNLFDYESDVAVLQRLAMMLRSMRARQTTSIPLPCLPSLNLDSVLAQTEVYAGVYHQALENLAIAGRMHPTIDLFNQIQQIVDQSKLKSINLFLHNPQVHEQARDSSFSQEYSQSHGQLPAQKLAAFLDALTDADMTEVGRWLLYSMDVDGPLIPLSVYDQPSLTPSILRFAAMTNDSALIDDVEFMVNSRGLKPAVTSLRSLADTRTVLRDPDNARHVLRNLSRAKGGGFHLRNLATIFATILRIEQSSEGISEKRKTRLLPGYFSLLDDTLHGHFSGMVGDFRRYQIKGHQRSLACLFRVLEAIPGSAVSEIARMWLPQLVQSAIVSLDPRVFNIILSAVVEVRGARAGIILWDLFCENSSKSPEQDKGLVKAAGIKLVSNPNDLEFQHVDSIASGSRTGSSKEMLPMGSNLPTSSTTKSYVNKEGRDRRPMTHKDGMSAPIEAAVSHIGVDDPDVTNNDHCVNTIPPSPLLFDSSSPAKQAVPERCGSHEEESTNVTQDPLQADALEFKDFETGDDTSPGATNDGFTLHRSPSAPIPVVMPTYRTFAIIVRSATREIQVAKALEYRDFPDVPFNISETPSKANMRALTEVIGDIEVIERWATPLFRKFGMDDAAVASEFKWELGESSRIFSTEQLQQKYRAASTEYQLAKMGVLANLSELQVWKRFSNPPVRRITGTVEERAPGQMDLFRWRKIRLDNTDDAVHSSADLGSSD